MKIAFTIATVSYLAQAKTLADSFLAHNPSYTFSVILLDRTGDTDLSFLGHIQVIEIEQLQLPFFQEMVERYSIFELSNALKPFCTEFFLHYDDNIEGVLYFDSDIMVYNELADIESLLQIHDLILTPHLFSPPPYDGLKVNENSFLNSGIYNGGFFAVKKSLNSLNFLNWWKERLRTQCFINFAAGMFVDQLWLNLAPLYFSDVKILAHVGYNVAFWNLHERLVTNLDGEALMVNDRVPLVFFHFSGYDINLPETISKYQTRISFLERPDAMYIYQRYTQAVLNNGYDRFSTQPCYFVIRKEKKIQEELEQKLALEQETLQKRKSLLKSILLRCRLTLRVMLKGQI